MTNDGIGYMSKNDSNFKSLRELNYFPLNFKIILGKNKYAILKFQAREYHLYFSLFLNMIDFLYCVLEAFEKSSVIA